MGLINNILKYFTKKEKEDRNLEYDKIFSCSINAEVKGVFYTTNYSIINELTEKYQTGVIDIGNLLAREFDNSEIYHQKKIIFCDKDNVVCLYNSKNDSYYEDVHEYFENAEESLYVKCSNNTSYEIFKDFVRQSSKYHEFIKYEYDIPKKKAFENIFGKTIAENNSTINKQTSKLNNIELEGKILKIGKEFIKEDNSKAQFVEIEQEYDYNGKIKKNIMSIMLEDKIINDYQSKLKLDDNVIIKGKLINYIDNNNKPKYIINCNEINFIEKEIKGDFER